MFANPTVFVPEGVVEEVWSDADVRSEKQTCPNHKVVCFGQILTKR